MSIRKNIFVVIGLLFFIGCAVTPSGRPPEVSLVDMQFSDVTLFETSADFVLRIQNENPYPLEVEGASHKITLNNFKVGSGLSDERITIPKLGTATQKVKVHLNNLNLIRNIQDLMEAQSFTYKIESEIFLSGTFSSSYLVSKTGRFNRP